MESARSGILQDICFNHSFTTLWKLKLTEIAKCTFNMLTLAISVEYVMSACVQTHVLQDITCYVTTFVMFHQEMP